MPSINQLNTADQVSDAIRYYAAGCVLEDKSKNLKTANRPVIFSFATQEFAKQWVADGTRPDNPKVITDPIGQGTHVGVTYYDQEQNLTDEQFERLSALIGVAQAEAWTIKHDEYILNHEMLEREVKIGNQVGRVIDFLDEAITAKFKAVPEVVEGLLTAKPVFKTRKGLIDQGLKFVGDDRKRAASKLCEFLEVANIKKGLKTGAGSEIEINGLDAYSDAEILADLEARGYDVGALKALRKGQAK